MEMHISLHWAQLTTIYYIFKMSLDCLTNRRNTILFSWDKMPRWYKRPTLKQLCTSVYLKLFCSINMIRCIKLLYRICYISLFCWLKMINYAIKPSNLFELQYSIHTSKKFLRGHIKLNILVYHQIIYWQS